MRSTAGFGLILLLCGCSAHPAHVAPVSASSERIGAVAMPGPRYEVLRSGPPDGAQPSRSDAVAIRYVGRLENGEIFSTSAGNGTETSVFPVRTVIPGFSALVQLMRRGDRWRFILPSYLAYGREGRRYGPGEATLKRDIPPDSMLTFDVELVEILPGE